MKTLKDAGGHREADQRWSKIDVARFRAQIRWRCRGPTVRAKAAVEPAGGSVRRVYYNQLGLRALLKPEWFEKKGRLLPRPARPPPKQKDRVDSIGRLPAPTKPIPLSSQEEEPLSAPL